MPLNELSSFLFRTQCQIHYLKCSFRSSVLPVLLTQAERHLHWGSTEMTRQFQKYLCTTSTHFFFRVLETKPVQDPESGREETEMGESSCLVQRHVPKM